MSNRKLAITEMHRATLQQYAALPTLPITLLLDDVRSTHNVGAIFRTCDAFRVEHISLSGITPVPPHPLIHKTALGAEMSVPFSYHTDAVKVVMEYKQKGYRIWVLEQTTNSIPPNAAPLDGKKTLLVAGNEVHGVNEEIVSLADACIEIPQYGTKHSLNVSVSVGIALYRIIENDLHTLQWCEKESI